MSETRLQHVLLAVVLALVILLTRLAVLESRRLEAAQASYVAGRIEQGGWLYHQHCRTCHGVRGEGIGQLGPPLSDGHFFNNRLKEVGWQATLDEYIVSTTEHGRMMGTRPIYAGNGSTAVMPPWHQRFGGGLRSDEIDALKTFILNWEPTATGSVTLSVLELPAVDAGSPEVIARGQQVFMNQCGSCHQFRDLLPAEVFGPDLTTMRTSWAEKGLDMELADYIRESVLIPAARVSEGFESHAENHPCGGVLTESDLAAVSGFLLN